MQHQIRKYLLPKKNNLNKKIFNRPQNKSKNNYLFLNSTSDNYLNDMETNNNPSSAKNYSNSKNNSPSDENKEFEAQAEIEKFNLNNNNNNNNQENNDSLLNNQIKYVENLRIQNAVYTGELLNGKRHGKGVQIWDDGAKYEGEWENDKSNGYGTFYHTDGDIYQGYWKKNAG